MKNKLLPIILLVQVSQYLTVRLHSWYKNSLHCWVDVLLLTLSVSYRKFFAFVCEVPEPEEKYNMDEFSDAVALSKPIIFISIKEILDTHKVCDAKLLNKCVIPVDLTISRDCVSWYPSMRFEFNEIVLVGWEDMYTLTAKWWSTLVNMVPNLYVMG